MVTVLWSFEVYHSYSAFLTARHRQTVLLMQDSSTDRYRQMVFEHLVGVLFFAILIAKVFLYYKNKQGKIIKFQMFAGMLDLRDGMQQRKRN